MPLDRQANPPVELSFFLSKSKFSDSISAKDNSFVCFTDLATALLNLCQIGKLMDISRKDQVALEPKSPVCPEIFSGCSASGPGHEPLQHFPGLGAAGTPESPEYTAQRIAWQIS